MYQQVTDIVHGKRFQNLCRSPYHNHPKGCPNYGKRPDCPPCARIDKVFDLSKPMYVIYTEYPVGQFAERMRLNHPEWAHTPRQWYNCIRWQGTARKQHKCDIMSFEFSMLLKKNRDIVVDTNPEALGINVTELMKQVGIDLEWNYHEDHDPERKTYRVSIAGNLK